MQNFRLRRARCVLSLLTLSLLTSALSSGCALPESSECWRYEWQLEVTERLLDHSARTAVTVPGRFRGRETWWVGPDVLVIDSRGREGARIGDGARTWILADEEWVYFLDPATGKVSGTPLARWDEERRRRSRSSLVETRRVQATSALSIDYGGFYGNLDFRPSRRRQGRLLAAVPGRLWHLYGGRRRTDAWRSPLLPLVFDGVSLSRAASLAPLLDEAQPRRIEDVTLPSGAGALVVERRLERLRPVSLSELRAGFPEEAAAQLRERESGWRSFRRLWRFWEQPGTRPRPLDRRGLRHRLEAVVGPAEIPTIRARIEETEDPQEREELFHLLYAADPDRFVRWLRAAVAEQRLPEVLEMVSVLSLRKPAVVREWVRTLLEHSPELWLGIGDHERLRAQHWLRGVVIWVSSENA